MNRSHAVPEPVLLNPAESKFLRFRVAVEGHDATRRMGL